MAINTSLFVVAPMIQNYFVDKTTGEPLANGIVTFYEDTSRTTLKNVYYQTGVPGNYTYLPLPNPIRLSAVGTPQDGNNNDIIPYYYPYDEDNSTVTQTYFVTVYSANSDGTPAVLQETRQNFPFVAPTGSINNVPTLRNYIINNTFWRHYIGTINVSATQQLIVSPSQHDGFRYPDVQWFKNGVDSTDAIEFKTFPTSTTISDTVLPEYYLNFRCTSAGTETLKYFTFPISLHLQSLQNQAFTATILASCTSGNSQITVSLLSDTGTGASSSSTTTLLATYNLSSTITQYILPTSSFPPVGSQSLGAGQDDAYYLVIGMPSGSEGICDINFTKPSVYLGTSVPTNDFSTYDQIDSVINTPRTGDVRTSLNAFNVYGWVVMNDGTIGGSSSNASTWADPTAWPLFNLIWNAFKQFDQGGLNPIAQMYTSAAATVAYGATAIADFTANRAIALTKMAGRIIMGTSPIQNAIQNYIQTFTRSGDNLVVASTTWLFTGAPIYFTTTGTLPSGISTGTIYYAVLGGATTIGVATTYANALTSTIVTLSSAGTGTHTVYANVLGAGTGEYMHTQQSFEVGAHSHSIIGSSADVSGGSGHVVYQIDPFDQSRSGTTTLSAPSAMNIVQLGTFMNIYMKL